jgi:hypothetical protein
MLIIVAVNAQQFPVAAVRGIVVMVMILVMDSQFTKSFALEFTPTPSTNGWKHFKGAFAISLHSLFLLTPNFCNELMISITPVI